MAHRIITQVVVVGSRVVFRAFNEAWKQAAATSKYQREGGTAAGGRTSAATGMTLDEACKILNVSPPKEAGAELEKVMERFKRLFDANDPKKGGSFYLQSKVLRARERLEMEVREAEERQRLTQKVKIYKD